MSMRNGSHSDCVWQISSRHHSLDIKHCTMRSTFSVRRDAFVLKKRRRKIRPSTMGKQSSLVQFIICARRRSMSRSPQCEDRILVEPWRRPPATIRHWIDRWGRVNGSVDKFQTSRDHRHRRMLTRWLMSSFECRQTEKMLLNTSQSIQSRHWWTKKPGAIMAKVKSENDRWGKFDLCLEETYETTAEVKKVIFTPTCSTFFFCRLRENRNCLSLSLSRCVEDLDAWRRSLVLMKEANEGRKARLSDLLIFDVQIDAIRSIILWCALIYTCWPCREISLANLWRKEKDEWSYHLLSLDYRPD